MQWKSDQLDLDELAFERFAGEALYDQYEDESPFSGKAVDSDEKAEDQNLPPNDDDDLSESRVELPLQDESENSDTAPTPLSAEELQKLLDAGIDIKLKQGHAENVEGLGLYISDLLGKIPQEQMEELRGMLGQVQVNDRPPKRRWMERRSEGLAYFYDEWDYHIKDYRQRWCRLLEIEVEGDSGEFFNQTLLDYSQLIPEVRRQFQKIRAGDLPNNTRTRRRRGLRPQRRH